ncbi:NUDIX domain-containing protein [Methylobacterium longum]|uniref:NUDIX domain-containing protein n=1 Tax=Methylobacterium longum TaxID=767694 RepID=A0ABT8AR14_9HYPH|nr:NUDIX domain-containing protein [Methylobacterium longum]MDN3572342.1 NUDIX domain-containing protein [Methylobacterium longum]GJE09514.1 hypothetical protein FOHLNKBM_0538 [Methylobacterium longum]
MGSYDNTPTVVVVLVPIRGGLLMIRRGVTDGHGELAMPGGYQMRGETWQEAGVREVLEETGVRIEADRLRLLTVVTTPDRRQNLLFGQTPPVEHEGSFVHDSEVLEVVVVDEPVRTAFPLHDEMVERFFRCRLTAETEH